MARIGGDPDPLDRGAVVVKGQISIFGNQNNAVLSFIPFDVDLGASDVDDLDPDDEESVIWKLSATAALTLSGIVARQGENRGLWLYNDSSFVITLSHQDTGSADTNRFSMPGGADFALQPGTACLIAKEDDTSASAWVLLESGGRAGFGDIPEDRILGRAVGAGTGPVQDLTPIQAATIVAAEVASLVPSLSVVHSSGTLQRAELVGEVTAAQNSNTLAIARNTNFDWTGIHNFTTLEYQNTTSSSISTDTNNWNPTGLGSNPVLYVDVSSTPTVTGMAAQDDGHIVTICVTGNLLFTETTFLEFENESSSSTAANRFVFPQDRNFGLMIGQAATFIYRTSDSRWHLLHSTSPGFGDTVSGDVVLCRLGTAGPLKTSTANSFYQTTRSSLLVHIDSSSIIHDLGTNTLQRGSLVGDVTAAQNSAVTTIANGVVTNAKRADMASRRISGRITAGSGPPEDLDGQSAGQIIADDSISLSWDGQNVYNGQVFFNDRVRFGIQTVTTTGSNLDLTLDDGAKYLIWTGNSASSIDTIDGDLYEGRELIIIQADTTGNNNVNLTLNRNTGSPDVARFTWNTNDLSGNMGLRRSRAVYFVYTDQHPFTQGASWVLIHAGTPV